jgi:hypothetical protein
MADEITEADLLEINGLVARHGYVRKNSGNADTLLAIELRLLRYGVRLEHAVGVPDPHAPQGGSHAAIRLAA